MSKNNGMIVVWPAYIDSQKSRKEGRMIPKNIAVELPSAEEILEACQELKLEPVLEPTKRMPFATWEKPGRILIAKRDRKLKLLREISQSVQRKRVLRKKA